MIKKTLTALRDLYLHARQTGYTSEIVRFSMLAKRPVLVSTCREKQRLEEMGADTISMNCMDLRGLRNAPIPDNHLLADVFKAACNEINSLEERLERAEDEKKVMAGRALLAERKLERIQDIIS